MSWFIFLVLAATGFGGAPGAAVARSGRQPSSEEERAELRIDEARELFGGALSVRLSAVRADSRCPREVNCVWSGDAEVVLEVAAAGESAELILHTAHGLERQARFAGYEIRVERLDPEPRLEPPIAREEYLATLAVERD